MSAAISAVLGFASIPALAVILGGTAAAFRTPMRISVNVTDDFGNVTGLSGRC